MYFLQAIEYYGRYAALADGNQSMPQLGEAYNCMGIDYMMLACPTSDAGFMEACHNSPSKPESESREERDQYLVNAIECHERCVCARELIVALIKEKCSHLKSCITGICR